MSRLWFQEKLFSPTPGHRGLRAVTVALAITLSRLIYHPIPVPSLGPEGLRWDTAVGLVVHLPLEDVAKMNTP